MGGLGEIEASEHSWEQVGGRGGVGRETVRGGGGLGEVKANEHTWEQVGFEEEEGGARWGRGPGEKEEGGRETWTRWEGEERKEGEGKEWEGGQAVGAGEGEG